MKNLDDSLPIFVAVSTDVTICSCCGKEKLKRTIKLSSPDIGEMHLGVICTGKWFRTNMTGNYYYAASKLQKKLRFMPDDEIEDIIEEIREASLEWK